MIGIAPSLHEAQAQLTAAADSYVAEAASFMEQRAANPAHDNYQQALAVYVRVAARYIKTSDRFLDLVSRLEGSLPSEIAAIVAVVRAGRMAAFMEIRALVPDDAWFWTEEWQARERAADLADAEGRYRSYDSSKAFLDSLRARM